MSTPVIERGMLPESTFELMARTAADTARGYFTDESIARVLERGVSGGVSWREVYDVICGAVTAKERAHA